MFGNTVLVTGANGRIGRLLRSQWREDGGAAGKLVWQVRNPAGSDEFAWDFSALTPSGWPGGGVILHLAGATGGDADHLCVNPRLAATLAGAAVAHKTQHIVFASSVSVYRPADFPLDEGMVPDPQTDYGRSKLAAEVALREGLRGSGTGLTCLRIGNVAGADALLGGALGRAGQPVVLDPVAGQPGGPLRSYIGPMTLARVLAALIARAPDLPPVVNVAQPGAIAMADLLRAAGLPWRFGAPRPGVVARVHVDTGLLQALVPVDSATAAGLVQELADLRGVWP